MRRFSILLASIAAIALFVAVDAAPAQEVEGAPITWEQAAMQDGKELYMELCAVCHGMDAKGKALFAELCAVCHGADAKGNGPASPALAAPAPDLTQLAMANGGEFPAKAVQKTIAGQDMVAAHGTAEMPMWGKVFEDARPDQKPGQRWSSAQMRIRALTEYVESLQVKSEMK